MASEISISYPFCLFCTTVDHNTLYYLFSTIAQSYGAIAGILGLFVVYRFERQSKNREDIRVRVQGEDKTLSKDNVDGDWRSAWIVKLFGTGAYGMSPDDLNDHYQHNMTKEQKAALEQLREGQKPIYDNLHTEMLRISNSIGITKRLEKSSKVFFPFHFFLILVSIICIFFSHGLVHLCGWVFSITILVFIASSILTRRLALDLIRTTERKNFPFKDPLKQ